jgi:hypothetical protein
MNFEHDEPERLAWTWDGNANLRAARAKWLAEMYHDFSIGRFDRIAKVMRAPRQREDAARPAPRRDSLNVPALRFHAQPQTRHAPARRSPRLEPRSAYSVAVLRASFPQPGDLDFVPCSAWQLHLHTEAMRE